jgi:hypothetical protein
LVENSKTRINYQLEISRDKQEGISHESNDLTEGTEKNKRVAGPPMGFQTGPLSSRILFSVVYISLENRAAILGYQLDACEYYFI